MADLNFASWHRCIKPFRRIRLIYRELSTKIYDVVIALMTQAQLFSRIGGLA